MYCQFREISLTRRTPLLTSLAGTMSGISLSHFCRNRRFRHSNQSWQREVPPNRYRHACLLHSTITEGVFFCSSAKASFEPLAQRVVFNIQKQRPALRQGAVRSGFIHPRLPFHLLLPQPRRLPSQAPAFRQTGDRRSDRRRRESAYRSGHSPSSRPGGLPCP